jgi:ATP-dependent 26S proteasome regulatory subunit
VKASSGPRYVVGCRNKVDKAKLASGTRVALDMTTLTIMRALPREVRRERQRAGSAAATKKGRQQRQ